jgi:uncharacterized protein (DUF2235 family)
MVNEDSNMAPGAGGRRRLVVLMDGTWNTPHKNRSNVAVFNDLIATGMVEGVEQVKPKYISGVGTHWWDRRRGGAFGLGLSRSIQEGYQWLQGEHRTGDDVYLLGFSRGGFAALGLAGFIQWCGLLKPSAPFSVEDLFTIYHHATQQTREQNEKQLNEFALSRRQLERLRNRGLELSEHARKLLEFSRPTRVRFLGVWDAVRAAGREPFVPEWRGRNMSSAGTLALRYTRHVPPNVDHAFQALAIDEHRAPFAPRMWVVPVKYDDVDDPMEIERLRHRPIEQRWFVGAHANVGGGSPGDPLALIPLAWMQRKAEACGLRFTSQVQPNADAFMSHFDDSYAKFFFLSSRLTRWFVKKVSRVYEPWQPWLRPVLNKGHDYHGDREPEHEVLDESVVRRWAQDRDYRPVNLLHLADRDLATHS